MSLGYDASHPAACRHLSSPIAFVAGLAGPEQRLRRAPVFDRIDAGEVNVQLTLQVIAIRKLVQPHRIQEGKMTSFFTLNTQDLAVMVGLGSFAGAAGGVAWDLLFSSGAPNAFVVAISAAGFFSGRLLSFRASRTRHAAS